MRWRHPILVQHRRHGQHRPFQRPSAAQSRARTTAKKIRIFSIALIVHNSTLDDFKRDSFPGTLKLTTGHAALYAWYLAMYEAWESGNAPWVAALWQAALIATVQAHAIQSHQALAILSMHATAYWS